MLLCRTTTRHKVTAQRHSHDSLQKHPIRFATPPPVVGIVKREPCQISAGSSLVLSHSETCVIKQLADPFFFLIKNIDVYVYLSARSEEADRYLVGGEHEAEDDDGRVILLLLVAAVPFGQHLTLRGKIKTCSRTCACVRLDPMQIPPAYLASSDLFPSLLVVRDRTPGSRPRQPCQGNPI